VDGLHSADGFTAASAPASTASGCFSAQKTQATPDRTFLRGKMRSTLPQVNLRVPALLLYDRGPMTPMPFAALCPAHRVFRCVRREWFHIDGSTA